MNARRVWVVALFFGAACDPGNVVLLSPNTSGGGAAPTLAIHATVDTPYVGLADSLGWTRGVPGAAVRIHLMADPYDSSYWHVVTADSVGLASYPAVGGPYEVEVSRTLTSAEMARAGGQVHLLAGGLRLYAPTTDTADVTMAPDQRGSLVFSELGLPIPASGYYDARYIELYNNSDTTIYLDGKLWGIGWDLNNDFAYWPCAQTKTVRNDPQGIWASVVFRFPGRGADYPVAPGQTVLIAKSAIDHRTVESDLYDLRQADFEWGGSGSADNPDVPDLLDIGPQPMVSNWPWYDGMPEFLAEATDLAGLPRYVDPYSGYVWVRIPAAAVLDVWVGAEDWTTTSYTPPAACLETAHRSFERLPGPAFANSDFPRGLSYQRRILLVLPDGRKVLQDTNTSMFDFVKAPRTPGWIPDSLP